MLNQRRVLPLSAAVLAVAGAAALGALRPASGSTAERAGGTATSSPASQDVEAEVLDAARLAANANGDGSYRNLRWVETTGADAQSALGTGSVPEFDKASVVLMQLDGDFTAKYAMVPPDAKTPTGTVITLIIETSTNRHLISNLGNRDLGLDDLGTVHTEPDSGPQPSATAQPTG